VPFIIGWIILAGLTRLKRIPISEITLTLTPDEIAVIHSPTGTKFKNMLIKIITTTSTKKKKYGNLISPFI
jgi:hypothetical protein